MPKRPRYQVRSGSRRAMYFGKRADKRYLEFTDKKTSQVIRTFGITKLDTKYRRKGFINIWRKK
jgi:hypothetical protein